ncbi:MAG: hypothetical protein LBN10_08895 [Propionibacteriaceae bacterium]|nr:hypothetical protein [Propionibacteriaceae bacterium]
MSATGDSSAEGLVVAPPPEKSAPTPVPIEAVPAGITTYPLHPVDPPKIGDFWPSARLLATESGVAYLGVEENATAPVMIILLSQGAAEDAAARDRLAGEVDRMDIDTVIARGGLDQDSGRLGNKFRSEDDDPHSVDGAPQAPWVALAFDQTQAGVNEAKRVLDQVDLAMLPQQGSPSGPDYRLHWSDRFAPGLTHVWPLPWPGRRERGGRLSILASWLLMLLLALLALLIAILIFSQAPPTPPPPPLPTSASDSGGGSGSPTDSTQSSSSSSSPESESASPESASPSPESESPSSESASPSPGSESPSGSGSPSPTGTESGVGSPTPPSKM